MNKLLITLALPVLLLACSGGGSSSPTAAGSSGSGSVTASGKTGTLVVNLTPAATTPSNTGISTEGITAQDALSDVTTSIRLLITNSGDSTYATFADVQVSNGTAVNNSNVVTIPVGTGYTLEAVSYIASGNGSGFNCYKTLLKYGKASGTFAITENAETVIPLTLTAISVNPTITVGSPGVPLGASIVENQTVTFTQSTMSAPLNQNSSGIYAPGYLFTSKTAIVSYLGQSDLIFNNWQSLHYATSLKTVNGIFQQQTPPETDTPGNYYFQEAFEIDHRFMQSGEDYQTWLFLYPNIQLGDAQVSIPYTIPATGSLGANITY